MWGGSRSCGDELAHFPRISESYWFMPLNFLLVHPPSHRFQNWDGRCQCLLAVPSLCLLFCYSSGGAGGVQWIREWSPRLLLSSKKGKCQKSCSPSYCSNTGPSIKTTTKGQPPPPSAVWFSKGTTLWWRNLLSYESGSSLKAKWAPSRSERTGSFLQAGSVLLPGSPSWQFTEGETTLLQLWSNFNHVEHLVFGLCFQSLALSSSFNHSNYTGGGRCCLHVGA